MIRKGLGRAAGWVGNKSVGPLIGVGIAGAAVSGVARGVLDDSGPYPRIQEHFYGDRRAIQESMSAGISHALSGDESKYGPGDYYYGHPVDVGRMMNAPTGDTVFARYNMRRGGR